MVMVMMMIIIIIIIMKNICKAPGSKLVTITKRRLEQGARGSGGGASRLLVVLMLTLQ